MREVWVVLVLSSPSRLAVAAEFGRVWQSVNLGVQAMEVIELGLVRGVMTLLLLFVSQLLG